MRPFPIRRIATYTVIGVGGIIAVLGAGLAIAMGPDGMRTSGPQKLDTDAAVIVTAPEALRWTNARIHMHASFDGPKPVFIGLGNAVDVDDYVAQARRTEVTSYRAPWDVETRDVDGETALPAAPTALDWWLEHSAGFGGATIDFTVPDETTQVVIMGFEGSDLSGLTVEVAYSLPIGFTGAVGLIPVGLGVALIGWWVGGGRSFWVEEFEDDIDEDDVDDAVYVWVDEDGVEHEISAEEAAEYEIVEEIVEEVDAGEDVVYVWVDDAGVEHEISAEEAAEYEIVEDTGEAGDDR